MNISFIRNIRSMIEFSLYIVTIILAVFILYSNRELLVRSVIGSPENMLIVIVMSVLSLILGAIYLSVILKIFGITIKTTDSARITVRSMVMDMVYPFKVGIGYRSYILKSAYGFPIKYSGLLYLGIYAFNFAASLIVVSIMLLHQIGRIAIQPCIVAILGGILIVFFIRLLGTATQNKYLSLITQYISGLNRKKVVKIVGLSIAVYFLSLLVGILVLMLLFTSFGVEINMIDGLFIYSLRSVMSLVVLTPGGLGVNEIATILGGKVLMVDAQIAVTASLLGHILTLFSGIFFLVVMFLQQLLTKIFVTRI